MREKMAPETATANEGGVASGRAVGHESAGEHTDETLSSSLYYRSHELYFHV